MHPPETMADFIVKADHLPKDFEAPGGNAWAEFYLEDDTTRRARALRIMGSFELKAGDETTKIEDGWLLAERGRTVIAVDHDELTQEWRPLAKDGAPDEHVTGYEHLQHGWDRIDFYLGKANGESNKAAARELALAKTAVEEAQMRTNRGLAILTGTYGPTDIEALHSERLS